MVTNINALDLLWMTLAMIAYAGGATLWAVLALPRDQGLPRTLVIPANGYFDSTPLNKIPATQARLAK